MITQNNKNKSITLKFDDKARAEIEFIKYYLRIDSDGKVLQRALDLLFKHAKNVHELSLGEFR